MPEATKAGDGCTGLPEKEGIRSTSLCRPVVRRTDGFASFVEYAQVLLELSRITPRGGLGPTTSELSVHLLALCTVYSLDREVSRMDLTFEKERLNRQFAGRISTEAVTKSLEDAATSLGRGARILVYIPLLAEQAARKRLTASLGVAA